MCFDIKLGGRESKYIVVVRLAKDKEPPPLSHGANSKTLSYEMFVVFVHFIYWFKWFPSIPILRTSLYFTFISHHRVHVQSPPFHTLSSNDLGTFSRLQNLPLTCEVLVLVVLSQIFDDLICNLLEVVRSKSQDGGAGAGQADAQETGLLVGRHGLDDLGEAGDEGLAVGLVDLVLHGEVDEFRVGRGLAESDG